MSTKPLPLHTRIPEPQLSFHPDRAGDREIHPLEGLLRFGPYSAQRVPDPIRVATLTPAGEGRRLYRFMRELNAKHAPRERRDYLPEWPGFSQVFRVSMRAAGDGCNIELSEDLERKIQESKQPHVVLSEELLRAIQRLEATRSAFDVLFIYLPKRWSAAFYGGDDEDFDLHDHLKAATAVRSIPIQLVREDSAVNYRCRASVMWRIGLALYAKAGGVPWKLADADPEVAFIGLSYAVRPRKQGGTQFVTCCSQVFDAGGSGLEFVAYDAHEVRLYRDNPFLSQNEMFRVMTRSLDLYRRRHAGQSPRRVMVHKTTEFKQDEAAGAMEAFHLCEAVDLVQVVQDVGWRGAKLIRGSGTKGAAAAYPVERGTTIGIGYRDALLWTHGDVEGLTPGKSYFKGARGTPRPLRLVRHAGHGTWDDTARGVLALTKMNWNNDSLYDPLPATLHFADVLADVVKRIPGLGTRPYQFRFFM